MPTVPTRITSTKIRTVKLCIAPTISSYGFVTLRVGKQVVDYFLRRLPSDFGVGFEFEKIGGEPCERYHVHLAAEARHTCECLGHLRHGHCKHVDGLLALQ